MTVSSPFADSEASCGGAENLAPTIPGPCGDANRRAFCREDESGYPGSRCNPRRAGNRWWATLRDAALMFEGVDNAESFRNDTAAGGNPQSVGAGGRLLNRDGRVGVSVHFDVRTPTAQSLAHGRRPIFTFTDESGRVFNTLIVYEPAAELQSGCACNAQYHCPDPRHGGYARYLAGAPGSGGQSGTCVNELTAGVDSAATIVHELGHAVGLQHGAPVSECRGEANPFAPPPEVLSEAALEAKLVHVSVMNYQYEGYPTSIRPAEAFSRGLNNLTPLPRTVGSTLGYPERDAAAWTEFLPTYKSYTGMRAVPSWLPVFAPGGGFFFNQRWSHLDINADGDVNDTIRTPIEGGSLLFRVRSDTTSAVPIWCATEGRVGVAGLGCCRTGVVDPADPRRCRVAGGAGGSSTHPFDEYAIARSQLFSAQPALAVEGADLWNFAAADVDLGPTARTDRSQIRFGRTGGFTESQGQAALDYPCTSNDANCVAPGSLPRSGDVTVDGALLEWNDPGFAVLSAASVTGSPGDVMFLGWTRRTGHRCAVPLPADGQWWLDCASRWGQPSLAWRRSGDPAGAFRSVALPTQANAAFANVSGVALVAWNPATGTRDRLTMLLRLPLRRDSTGLAGGEIARIVCELPDASSSAPRCGAPEFLTNAVGQRLQTGTGLAATLQGSDLLLVRTQPRLPADEESASNLLFNAFIDRFQAGANSLAQARAHGVRYSNSQIEYLAYPESGFSLAIDRDGRAVLSTEWPEPDEGAPERRNYAAVAGANGTAGTINMPSSFRWNVLVQSRAQPPTAPDFLFGMTHTNQWRLTRGSVAVQRGVPSVGAEASGTWVPVFASGPGAVPVVFQDPRTGITTPRVQGLESMIREFGIDFDASYRPKMSLRGVIGATLTNPHYSFEEVGTIGWSMCRNNAATCDQPNTLTGDEGCNGAEPTSAFQRARWSPYLHGLRRGIGGNIDFYASTRVLCPSGAAFAQNSPAAWNVAAFLYTLAPPTRPSAWHQNLSELIADRIVDGGFVNADALAPHLRELVDAQPEISCRLPGSP